MYDDNDLEERVEVNGTDDPAPLMAPPGPYYPRRGDDLARRGFQPSLVCQVLDAARRSSASVREWRARHAPMVVEVRSRRDRSAPPRVELHYPYARPDLSRVYRAVGLTSPGV